MPPVTDLTFFNMYYCQSITIYEMDSRSHTMIRKASGLKCNTLD